ncbi:MAG TPA: nuclear transport factor 2 family protein [Burkholderiales bacterium]|nr:nuclear transport factor 2 family protein [Burkholderiales bacterium]
MAEKLEDLLFGLEEKFWLKGAEHYAGNLSPAAVMVFPDPAGVLVKDEIERSIAGGARWSDVALEEHRLVELNDRAAVVTYKATARRDGEAKPYVARASSAYVHDGRAWRLAFHQQTPL